MTTSNSETDNKEALFVRQLLDSYFRFRENLPTEGYIQECKTTEQIKEELQPMFYVSMMDIAGYMIDHGYLPITEPDGTVAWSIWRNINISENIGGLV